MADQINFADDSFDTPDAVPRSISNATALSTMVSVFVCPSEDVAAPGSNSYRQNIGVISLESYDARLKGLSSRLAAFTDGLSKTALFSERLIASPTSRSPAFRNPWLLNIQGPVGSELLAPCIVENDSGRSHPFDNSAGACWLFAHERHAYYYHFFPPNSPWFDCELAGGPAAALSVRSNHPGGACTTFADGHVEFVDRSVNRAIWVAMGTAGGSD